MNEQHLERALFALGPQVEFPATPELTGRVAAAITHRPHAAPRRRLLPAFATAAVVLFAASMVVSSGARRAVADWLGLGGVRITYDEPPADPDPAGADLRLGERIALPEARDRAGFPLRFPAPDLLGGPDETYFATADGFDQVSFVYEPDDGLPAARGRQAAILFVQFRGEPSTAYFGKMIDAAPGVEEAQVNGAPALWLEGVHVLQYVGPDGTFLSESTRLAAGTLLWEENGITYRLESDLTKPRAVALAEALSEP